MITFMDSGHQRVNCNFCKLLKFCYINISESSIYKKFSVHTNGQWVRKGCCQKEMACNFYNPRILADFSLLASFYENSIQARKCKRTCRRNKNKSDV